MIDVRAYDLAQTTGVSRSVLHVLHTLRPLLHFLHRVSRLFTLLGRTLTPMRAS